MFNGKNIWTMYADADIGYDTFYVMDMTEKEFNRLVEILKNQDMETRNMFRELIEYEKEVYYGQG